MPASTIVTCGSCGRRNRVPAATNGTPGCGQCHTPLPWIADARDQDFTEIAEQSPLPVLRDLWAPWCGPCRMGMPSSGHSADARATATLVTHDQSEALSLADDVAVMRSGRLVEQGPPDRVYRQPVDVEVAAFLGAAVVLPGQDDGTTVRCALGELPLRGERTGPVRILVRPERLALTPPGAGAGGTRWGGSGSGDLARAGAGAGAGAGTQFASS